MRFRPASRRPAPATYPGPRRAHPGQLARALHLRGRERALRITRTPPPGMGDDRARTRGHRAPRICGLLSHRQGDRRLLRPQWDPLPGQGERSQLGGVLLPGNHSGGRGAPQPAVRAIFIRCALGATGYRRRYRGVSSRRGHPVRLRHVWEGSRGPGRERHYLPTALSDP